MQSLGRCNYSKENLNDYTDFESIEWFEGQGAKLETDVTDHSFTDKITYKYIHCLRSVRIDHAGDGDLILAGVQSA